MLHQIGSVYNMIHGCFQLVLYGGIMYSLQRSTLAAHKERMKITVGGIIRGHLPPDLRPDLSPFTEESSFEAENLVKDLCHIIKALDEQVRDQVRIIAALETQLCEYEIIKMGFDIIKKEIDE